MSIVSHLKVFETCNTSRDEHGLKEYLFDEKYLNTLNRSPRKTRMKSNKPNMTDTVIKTISGEVEDHNVGSKSGDGVSELVVMVVVFGSNT